MANLAFARDGPFGVAKRLQGVGADIIEPLLDFGVEPERECARFDAQFVPQGIRCDGTRSHVLRAACAMVHQTATQVGFVDVSGNARVVTLLHHDGEREAVQDALDGALPRCLVGVHLEPFAGER